MKKENDTVVAVTLTGDGTKRRRQQMDDNTDASLWPPKRRRKQTDENTDAWLHPSWTDDKHRVLLQEKRRRPRKSRMPWLEEEDDLKDGSVSGRTKLDVTFLLVETTSKIASDLMHPLRLITLLRWLEVILSPSMPSIVCV